MAPLLRGTNPSKSETNVNSSGEVKQSRLFRVYTFEHELGISSRVELDKISIVVIDLDIL